MILRIAQKALPLLLLSILAACSSAVPQTDSDPRKSTDPVITAVLESFTQTCIAQAPNFSEEALTLGISENAPAIGKDMMLLGTAEDGRTCRFYVRGYGTDRAVPTVGDINALAEALHARVGGSLRPKTPTTGTSGAQIRKAGAIYNIHAYVNAAGDLEISISS